MKVIYSLFSICCALAIVQANCPYNCSGNGDCSTFDDKCQCYWTHYGSDCSEKALLLQKGVPLELKYYYVNIYHVFAEDNPTPQKLYFKYTSTSYYTCSVQVLIQKQDLLTILYEKSITFSIQLNSAHLDLSSEVQMIGNILTISIESIYKKPLTITYGNQQEDMQDTTISGNVLIIAIVIPLIAIVIIFIICFIKIWPRLTTQRIIQPLPRQNLEYLQQKYIPSQQIMVQQPQQQISQINPNEECSICLQVLQNGMPLRITPCLHKFHGNCILEVLMRQQSCPNCRAYFQSNQLIGINQPNQFQAQLV